MNTLAALAAATARAASEIAQLCCAPPFPCCLREMEVFEDVDKAGFCGAAVSRFIIHPADFREPRNPDVPSRDPRAAAAFCFNCK